MRCSEGGGRWKFQMVLLVFVFLSLLTSLPISITPAITRREARGSTSSSSSSFEELCLEKRASQICAALVQNPFKAKRKLLKSAASPWV